MLTLIRSGQFKRDLKLASKRGKDIDKLQALLELLMKQVPLPASYQDHPLRGKWNGCRDAHIEPDWLLIYYVAGDELHLVRIGSHADLF